MKRISGILGAFLILLSGFQAVDVHAKEQKSYNSDAGVSFYGEYEYPEEETQETGKNTDVSTASTSTKISTLPRTGDAANFLYVYGGMGIIALSFFLIGKKESYLNSSQSILQ